MRFSRAPASFNTALISPTFRIRPLLRPKPFLRFYHHIFRRVEPQLDSSHKLHYRRQVSFRGIIAKMSHSLYGPDTPPSVSEDKGLHLVTMSTPNGQKVQILLEELHDIYGTTWGTTTLSIMTNEQKKDWFLRLDPNGRIPIIVDNTQSPPFTVHETSAELLYLLKFADKKDLFGFKDEYERSQCLQWLFFWHGSGAPYQGQLNHFGKFAKDKIPCKCLASPSSQVQNLMCTRCHRPLPRRGSARLRRARDQPLRQVHRFAPRISRRKWQGQVLRRRHWDVAVDQIMGVQRRSCR